MPRYAGAALLECTPLYPCCAMPDRRLPSLEMFISFKRNAACWILLFTMLAPKCRLYALDAVLRQDARYAAARVAR